MIHPTPISDDGTSNGKQQSAKRSRRIVKDDGRSSATVQPASSPTTAPVAVKSRLPDRTRKPLGRASQDVNASRPAGENDITNPASSGSSASVTSNAETTDSRARGCT